MMMDAKRLFLFSFAYLLVCAPCQLLPSPPESDELYESRRVARIDIQAENLPAGASFDPRPVREKLNTKAGDPFSPLVFDSDLRILSDQYDRVEPQITTVDGTCVIVIKVWLRPTIRTIVWQGNTHFKSSTLKKELAVKENTLFHRVDFNKKFNALKEYYIKKGYFESQLSYTVIPISATNEVDIQIDMIEGRAGIVADILFQGFTSHEKSLILSTIYTKSYSMFTSWLTGSGILHEEAIEQDRLTILTLLHNEGYADAKVDLQITNAEQKGRVVIVLTVDRGPEFHYGNVTFIGNTLFTNQEIEKLFLIHPGESYSSEKLRQTAEAIKNLYGRKGRIDANVQYETQLVEELPIYDVRFTIEEGGEYKIGLIRLFGNEQTKSHVILRESLLVPGETFDSVRLKATQERLQNIGYFSNVNVYAVRAQEGETTSDHYRDVYIEVEEAPTGHVSLFFGLSSGDGLFGGLDVTETNFNYLGFQRLLKDGPSAMRGGGEFAHAKVTLGSKQRTYLISWLTPYFRDTLWRVGFETFLSQSQLQAKDYEIDSIGGALFASYPLTTYWTVGTKYRVKHAKIDVSHGVSQSEQSADKGSGNISAASTSINYDSTDNITKPHKGLRTFVELEYAGVGGDFSFLKYSYVNAFYQQLWRCGIIKYRWEAKLIQPTWWTSSAQDIPLSERFFIGGENSVRGYRAFNLGPKFPNGDPSGGVTYSVLSLEYLHEMLSMLDGFAFIDAGSISDKKFRFPQYQMSYGVGVRVEVMRRMPITVGVGFPVNPVHRHQIQKVFFSMGGQF